MSTLLAGIEYLQISALGCHGALKAFSNTILDSSLAGTDLYPCVKSRNYSKGHKCHDWDSNPHSDLLNHQNLNFTL